MKRDFILSVRIRIAVIVLLALVLLFTAIHTTTALAPVERKGDYDVYALAMEAEKKAKQGAMYEDQWVTAYGYLTAFIERDPVFSNPQQKQIVEQHYQKLSNYVKVHFKNGKEVERYQSQVTDCMQQAGMSLSRASMTANTAPEELPVLPTPVPMYEVVGVWVGGLHPSASTPSNPQLTIVASGDLFVDEFDGPALKSDYQPLLPNAGFRYGDDMILSYQGEPQYDVDSVPDLTFLRLYSGMESGTRKGWSTKQVFLNTGAPMLRLEVRFFTYEQTPDKAMDQMLEIWLIDGDNLSRFDQATIYSINTNRYYSVSSTVSNRGGNVPFNFTDNTWYRLVITGSGTQPLRASIYNDWGDQELAGFNLYHTFADYPNGFRLGISHSVSTPGGYHPTLVALDYVRLSVTP